MWLSFLYSTFGSLCVCCCTYGSKQHIFYHALYFHVCVTICRLLWCTFVLFMYYTYFSYNRNPFRDPLSCFYKLIFFSTQHYVCVHFPAYSWFVCMSVLHREFLILWPALLAVPLFVNVCVYHINLCMYTTKYTPFFIHNLQKGKIFFVWGWGKIPGCS